MLGDIVKVTPTSKAVGDMAIFMVQNDLTKDNIYEKAKGMDFPDSIVSYFEGMMGQPIAVIEAMKMETNIISLMDGDIDKIYVKQGEQVVSNQLIAKLKYQA